MPPLGSLSLSLNDHDSLFCSEEPPVCHIDTFPTWDPPPTSPLQHDLSWEYDELASLLSKQSRTEIHPPELSEPHSGAVEWVLRVHARYGFSPRTAVLAVDYLDRFLLSCRGSEWNRAPWMGQLAAVACLSLAAKVEEVSVPLLVDFQVEESAFVFEAKTIKRMELLVLSTLRWRMNPATPLSFLDYIARTLRFGDQQLLLEFIRRSEDVLLSVLSDDRLLQFLPSVVAAATALQVLNGFEEQPELGEEWQSSELLDILASDDKEKVEACRVLIAEDVFAAAAHALDGSLRWRNKREYSGAGGSVPGSPRGVVDYVCLSPDSSNDSWAAAPPSLSSSPVVPPFKKHRSSH